MNFPTSSLTADQLSQIKVILWNNDLSPLDPEEIPDEQVYLILRTMNEISSVVS